MGILAKMLLSDPESDDQKTVYGAIDRYQMYKTVDDVIRGGIKTFGLGRSKNEELEEEDKILRILEQRQRLGVDSMASDTTKSNLREAFLPRFTKKVTQKSIKQYLEGLI